MDQRLPGNGFRQNAKSNRILKFLRRTLFLVIAVIVVVEGAAIVADLYDRYLFAALAGERGQFFTGNACNIVVAARLLFWLMLVIELVAVARAVTMQPSAVELEEFHTIHRASVAIQTANKKPKPTALGVSFVIGTCYLASYGLAYNSQRSCSDAGLASQLLIYWHVFAVYAARGVFLFTACYLYFKWKKVPGSNSVVSTGPLT